MAFKGLRFQKRIKVAPGIRVNLSKSGVSTSFGGPGASLNVGKKGVTGTVGAPGTGLSYSKVLIKPETKAAKKRREAAQAGQAAHLLTDVAPDAAPEAVPAPEKPSLLGGFAVLVLLIAVVWWLV